MQFAGNQLFPFLRRSKCVNLSKDGTSPACYFLGSGAYAAQRPKEVAYSCPAGASRRKPQGIDAMDDDQGRKKEQPKPGVSIEAAG